MNKVASIVKLSAIIVGTLLLARALYATELGNRALRLVPQSAWDLVNERMVLEGAETTSNVEIMTWLLVCWTISSVIVLGGDALMRWLLRWRLRGQIDNCGSHRLD